MRCLCKLSKTKVSISDFMLRTSKSLSWNTRVCKTKQSFLWESHWLNNNSWRENKENHFQCFNRWYHQWHPENLKLVLKHVAVTSFFNPLLGVWIVEKKCVLWLMFLCISTWSIRRWLNAIHYKTFPSQETWWDKSEDMKQRHKKYIWLGKIAAG